MLTGLVVVCTYRRPDEVRELGELLRTVRGGRGVLVVDASPDDATELVCRSLGFVEYLRSDRAGLAFQRNRGVEHARARGVAVVHFLDDDCRPFPGYFEAIEETFVTTGAAGVGGTVVDERTDRRSWLTRLFLIDGPHPGRVLPSGHATVGPGGDSDVEWLQGSAMSYRVDAIRGRSFDERLDGYSWGEDRDFSYRLGRDHRLCVSPAARARHLRSPVNRASARRFTRDRVPLQHRWVGENRGHGMRRWAFWWSVAGEALLRAVAGTFAAGPDRARHWGVVRGLLDGTADIVRGRGPR